MSASTEVAAVEPDEPVRTRHFFLSALKKSLRRNKVAQVAVVILVLVVLVGIFGPLIAPHDPAAQDLTARLKPPFWLSGHAKGYLLGTDSLGRDVLSRVIYGTRISLLVGVAATLMSGVIGAVLGMLCGYYRGWVDMVFMRLADVQLSFPTILLALVIVAVLGPSLLFVILVLGATGWVSYARVIRAEVLSLRSREFVTAARAAGVSDLQIMWRHLRPNVFAPLMTIGTLQVAAMIVAEASLSYLGLGVPPTIPTWGGMLADGQLYIRSAWWISVFSGVAIMLTTLSINIAGDMLRDIADPKAYR
ncbi:MAG TPA: ABC transporter permease [Pseudonocardiaceae bacterium]|jgi:peptide/nickel transport system permease protein|nr:ABC transporter permease [Pseudonocardiaceae bacterium]